MKRVLMSGRSSKAVEGRDHLAHRAWLTKLCEAPRAEKAFSIQAQVRRSRTWTGGGRAAAAA